MQLLASFQFPSKEDTSEKMTKNENCLNEELSKPHGFTQLCSSKAREQSSGEGGEGDDRICKKPQPLG